MTKDEALNKIATVNAMDYEYQAWAREALAQPCGLECDCTDVCKQVDYKALWQQMCERCDELDKKLAQPEQAPMNYYRADAEGNLERIDFHSAQPNQDWVERERAVGYREGHMAALAQRTWVGLTDEEIKALASWWPSYDQMPALMVLAKDIQNSLKEKNT